MKGRKRGGRSGRDQGAGGRRRGVAAATESGDETFRILRAGGHELLKRGRQPGRSRKERKTCPSTGGRCPHSLLGGLFFRFTPKGGGIAVSVAWGGEAAPTYEKESTLAGSPAPRLLRTRLKTPLGASSIANALKSMKKGPPKAAQTRSGSKRACYHSIVFPLGF